MVNKLTVNKLTMATERTCEVDSRLTVKIMQWISGGAPLALPAETGNSIGRPLL
jgi:hypothetical protein